MKIDNEPIAAKVKLIYMAIPLVIVLATGSTYLIAGVREIMWLFIGVGLLILFFIIMALLKLQYVVLFVSPDKIVLRYKSLSPFRTPNNSIEIKSPEFAGYEFASALGGLQKNLIVYKTTPGGKAKFPKVGIGLISIAEKEKIKRAFDLLISLNTAKS